MAFGLTKTNSITYMYIWKMMVAECPLMTVIDANTRLLGVISESRVKFISYESTEILRFEAFDEFESLSIFWFFVDSLIMILLQQ